VLEDHVHRAVYLDRGEIGAIVFLGKAFTVFREVEQGDKVAVGEVSG
jgi:hypothetical protein